MQLRCRQCGARVEWASVDVATQAASCASCGARVSAAAVAGEGGTATESVVATETGAARRQAIPRGVRFAAVAAPEFVQTYRETAIAGGRRWACRPWRPVHMLPLIFAGVAAMAPVVLQPSRGALLVAAGGGLLLLLAYLWVQQSSTIELGAGGLSVIERSALPWSRHVTIALSEIDSFYAAYQGSSALCVVGVLDRELHTTVVVDCLSRDEAEYLAGALNEALQHEVG